MSDRRLGRKRKKKNKKLLEDGGGKKGAQKKKKCKKKTAFDRLLLESKPRDKFESLETHLFFFRERERRKRKMSPNYSTQNCALSDYSLERCEYSVSQLVDDTEEDDEKEEEEVQSSSLKTSHRETTRTSSHHYSVSGSGFGSFLRRRRGLTRDAASTSFPRASSSERFKKWTGRTIARRRRDGRRRRRRIEKPLL